MKVSLKFVSDSGRVEEIKTKIINKGIDLENHLKEFLNVFLVGANINSKLDESRWEIGTENLEEKFTSMISCFRDFYEDKRIGSLFRNKEVEKIMPYFEEVKKEYCENHIPRRKDIHKSLVKYFYYSEFRRMYNVVAKKKEINSGDDYSKVRTYFKHIVSLFKEMCQECLDHEQIKQCLAYINTIITQMEVLGNITEKNSSTIMIATTDFIKKNLSQEEDFARVILDIKIKKDERINYYESLYELINENVDEKEAKKRDAQDLKEKKNYFLMLTQKEQTNKMIDEYLGRNDREIALAINKLYDIYERRNNIEEHYQQEFNFNEILLKCARLLRSIGHSHLAIKIYKKLKHFQKVEDCVQEMSLEIEGEEKVQFYLDQAEYFREIGDRTVSWKYIQKAFEENTNDRQLEDILKAKRSFF